MPLYEYKCSECGKVFEVRQKFSDDPLKTHEGCGGAVERLLSAPALQFKGTGFYITDYANGKSSANGKSHTSSNGSDSSEASKSESKPASTTSSTTSDKK